MISEREREIAIRIQMRESETCLARKNPGRLDGW